MRADLYLHHVRIFKSRSLATRACAGGHVKLSGAAIKPARDLKAGDTLEVTRADTTLVIRVLGLPSKRIGAPLVARYLEDLTPPENLRRAAEARKERALTAPPPRSGRPDKKQWRILREWLGRE